MYEINTFDYLYYIHMCVCVCVCVCVGGGGGPICHHYKMKQGPTGFFLCVWIKISITAQNGGTV